VPDPALLCVGEVYTQTTRVVKLGALGEISNQAVYCRNLP
jgi:hypothetical protein